jgi:CubicO group peptidase (beta-lactamase class C family)
MSMKRICGAVVLAFAFAATTLSSQSLPTGTPESVGVSTERLDRLHRGMQGFVDRHEVAGIVTLIERGGKVIDLRAYGMQDAETRTPMKTDTLFRIASMSKPITSVAVMMLYEEGRLALTDPVSRYIPAFKDTKVLAKSEGGVVTLEAAKRQITIRDLLTHRSGLSYGFLDGSPVGEAYRRTGVSDGLTVTSGSLAENIDKLAQAPLQSQPGAEWHYSLGVDVLGRVIEVVSGMPFDVFLRERIFKPLKMDETGFDVPDAKWSRFATVYSPDGNGGVRPMKDPETFTNTIMSPNAYYKAPKHYFSGGAGLTSKATDYARFAQMLLNGGELDGVRLLSPKTIELMTVSHTADIKSDGPIPVLGAGAGFGLGFKVTTDLAASQATGSEGNYGWSGIYGTNFWVDPKEKMAAVMMVQRYPGAPVAAAFQTLVYQSLIGAPVPVPVRAPASRVRTTTSNVPATKPAAAQAAAR